MSSPRPPFVAARAIFKLQDDIEERRREAAGEGSERRDRDGRPHWLDYLAISTALFAVFAAAACSANSILRQGVTRVRRHIWTHRSPSPMPAKRRTSGR